MSRSIGRFRYLVVLLGAAVFGTAGAADWSLEPSIAFRAGYDSNIRLDPARRGAVWGAILSPGLKLNYETERRLISGGLVGRLRRYTGEDSGDLNAEDLLLNLVARERFETGSVGLKVDVIRDSTLATELEETGLVRARKQRNSIDIQPDWIVRLNERTALTLGYRFVDVGYEDAAASGLVDYRRHAVFSSLEYKLSRRDEVTATVDYSRLDVQQSRARFNTATLLFGYRRLFSETLTSFLTIGATHIESKNVLASEETGSHAVGSVGLEKRLERGIVSARVSRGIAPTGAGGLVQTDRAAVAMSIKLRETMAASVNAAAYRTESAAGTVFNVSDSNFYEVEPTLSWQLTRELAIGVGYRYRYRRIESENSASGNTVYLTAVYNWAKLGILR